jgi:ABC-type uncharacterized transport system permease subunit
MLMVLIALLDVFHFALGLVRLIVLACADMQTVASSMLPFGL